MKLYQITILFIGLLLVLGILHMDRLINDGFESSMTSLEPLLPSKYALEEF